MIIMAILPAGSSDISDALQFLLILIAVATAFIGMKIKIEKKMTEPADKLEKKIFSQKDDSSIIKQISNLWHNHREMERRINSHNTDIARLKDKAGII